MLIKMTRQGEPVLIDPDSIEYVVMHTKPASVCTIFLRTGTINVDGSLEAVANAINQAEIEFETKKSIAIRDALLARCRECTNG